MKYDIVTIGDASEDIFVKPKELRVSPDPKYLSGKGVSFELGEKIPLEEVEYEVGGSACNNAVAFSRMGYKTSAIVAIGPDTPGDKIREKFAKADVDMSLIKSRQSYKTNFSVIFNINGERTIFVYHGMDDYSCLKPAQSLSTSWIFLAPLGHKSDEVVSGVVALAAEKNVRIAWNPGTMQIEKRARHYKGLLSCTDILFLNREEAIKFAGFPVPPELKELIRSLHHYGPKIVVITNGRKGATAYDGEHFYHSEIINVERVDATGAGDSFASGFTGRLIDEGGHGPGVIMEALAWGVVNSSSVVSYVGAQKGLLSKRKIEEEVSSNKINIEMD